MLTITAFMGEDHKKLDGLFKSYIKNKEQDRKKAAALFGEFRVGLLKHIAWEEEVLFPMVAGKFGGESGPIAVMRLEHQEITDLLEGIRKRMPGTVALGAASYEWRLEQVLTEHNRKEEAILYPSIDQELGEKDRREILEKLKGYAACP